MKYTTVRVVVGEVNEGPHGPFALAFIDDSRCPKMKGTSVTFSLGKSVWKEKVPPEPGDIVILSQIVERAKGFRAKRARLARLGDDA